MRAMAHPTDRELAELAETLHLEYLGAVHAGRVRQVVRQSGRSLRRVVPDLDTLVDLVEQSARRTLVQDITAALVSAELAEAEAAA